MYNKIKETSKNKVNGRLVKFSQGDCLSIRCDNKYLVVIVAKKFNKYYDLTLLDYYDEKNPGLEDVINCKFFGKRFGSIKRPTYAVNVRMIECKYIDKSDVIEKIGSVSLPVDLPNDGYAYLDNEQELLQYFLSELPTRRINFENAENDPDIDFEHKNLIELRQIAQ